MIAWVLVLAGLAAGGLLLRSARRPEEGVWDSPFEEPSGDGGFAFRAGRTGPPADLPSRPWSIVRVVAAVMLVAGLVAAIGYGVGFLVNEQLARMLTR